MMNALQQISYLWADIGRMTNGRLWRWYSVFFSPGFAIVFSYRINRLLYLLLGNGWRAVHTLLAPLAFLLRPWLGTGEIHYMADIGPGLMLLHPSLGVVISKYTVAGRHLTLGGGNCIGAKTAGKIIIGDDVLLGISANVLGPVVIGSGVTIGMSALVLHDAGDGLTLVGVPAHPVNTPDPAYTEETHSSDGSRKSMGSTTRNHP